MLRSNKPTNVRQKIKFYQGTLVVQGKGREFLKEKTGVLVEFPTTHRRGENENDHRPQALGRIQNNGKCIKG